MDTSFIKVKKATTKTVNLISQVPLDSVKY